MNPEADASEIFPFSSVLLIGCAICFLIAVAACIGLQPMPWALILLRAPDFGIVLLWLAAATGFGTAIFKLTRLHQNMNGMLVLVTAAAIGLGLMSLFVLVIGMCVRISAPLAWGLLILGCASGIWSREIWLVLPKCDFAVGSWRWLILLCAAALGLATVAALVPPGLLWGDEPNGYDVLEYHLQVPREWYELGRIVPLQHNVFSYFPFNVEMHYLLAMALRGGPWSGMYLAQLMHVAFIALTVLAIYALAAQRSKPTAIVAATAVATVPWMGLLAPVAYDEGGLLLWGTLAIGLSVRRFDNWRLMSLAGAMAGFACGSKLTAVPIVLLAIPVIHVLLARFSPKAVLAAASFLLAGTLIFSPWLLKNIAWVGNPVFPEETAIFGRGHWSETQVKRWILANHLPRADQQNMRARVAAGWNQILADWRYGYALLPLSIVAGGFTWKDRQTKALLLLLLFLAVFWLLFTHLQSRFFTLAIPLSALLIGQIEMRRGLSIVYPTIVVLAGFGGLFSIYEKMTSINSHLFDFIGVENLNGLTPLADTTVSPDTRVVLVGDGRPFLYQVPTDRLFYRTVFDVDAKPGEASDEAWRAALRPWQGPTVEVVDAPELRRFAKTYWGIPLPSEGVMQMQGATVR